MLLHVQAIMHAITCTGYNACYYMYRLLCMLLHVQAIMHAITCTGYNACYYMYRLLCMQNTMTETVMCLMDGKERYNGYRIFLWVYMYMYVWHGVGLIHLHVFSFIHYLLSQPTNRCTCRCIKILIYIRYLYV